MYRQPAVNTTAGLDRRSPVPLYYQLKQILTSWISSGQFEADSRFPSETELQARFNVSRMTVRRALSDLVAEGFLIREQGRGSFVVRHRLQDQLRRLTSFSEDIRLRGLDTAFRVLFFQAVRDAEVARKMGVPDDEELVCIRRVRSVNGEPFAVQNAYVRHRFCPGIVQKGLVDGSLYRTIEVVYGLRLARAVQTLVAKPADQYEAELLKIAPGQPVLAMERTTYLQDGTSIEWVASSYRGDRYRFTVELSR